MERTTKATDEAVTRTVTPIEISRRTAYIAGALAVLLLIVIVRAVPLVLVIAIGGGALALLLSYPVRLLERVLPRRFAVLVTLLTVVALLIGAGLLILPPVVSQMGDLAEELPDIARRANDQLRDVMEQLEADGRLPADAEQVVGDIQQGLLDRATVAAESLLNTILDTITGAAGLITTAFGTLFVAVYLLLDAQKLRTAVISHAPARYREDVDQLWDDMGRSLSRYLAGLMVTASVQGVLAGVGLLALGVPYALLLGLWIALTSVVPYLGAWLGAIPALILAYLQSPATAVWTFILYFVINTIEGNFLTPRVQGEAVQVHPILVLLTVVAAGGLFGLLGVILAVPMLAIGRVLFDFFRSRVRIADRNQVLLP